MPIPAGPTTDEAASGLSGPCADWEPPAAWCCTLTGVAASVTGDALAAATEILFFASGQQFGLCEQTLRPCRRDCEGTYWGANQFPEWGGGLGSTYPQPALIDGQWYNLTCGTCGDNCSCSMISEAMLPGPVWDITEVKVDGVVLSADDYRVDDHRILVRLGGEMWPWCNDLSVADTEVGTWSVTARFGQPPPVLGSIAVGELACQIAKLIACDSSCVLSPFFLTSLNRQGVSMTFDPQQEFGMLPATSLFVKTFNPYGLRGRAQAYNLDGPTFRLAGT